MAREIQQEGIHLNILFNIHIAETQTQLNERHLPVARTYTHLNGCFFIGDNYENKINQCRNRI